MKTQKGKQVNLQIGEPILLKQGEPGDQVWGHYQFPNIGYTLDGKILAAWEYGTDNITYNAMLQRAVFDDGGDTWLEPAPADAERPGYKMKNGRYFKGFKVKGAHRVDYLEKYTPAFVGKDMKLYFAEDLNEPEDTKVWGDEFDPVTGKTETFEAKVNWPYCHVSARTTKEWMNYVYPVTMVFALCNHSGIVDIDGDMYFATYSAGFNAEAKNREEAVYKHCGVFGCYVFRSCDCGRTWDFASQVLVDDETFSSSSSFEGFCEPMMEKMPDGSIVMLIRTGNNCPSYIVRSTDNCQTWSKPEIFDDVGVYPQILTLKNGVTLASYGRPTLRVRATADPAGLKWDEPVMLMDFKLVRKSTSCCYTKLLALDDHTALMIYSDFQYPHPSGEKARAILVRKLTVAGEN